MIAFHYPPLWGSSGLQRTLKFSRYLLHNDWEPKVLTAHPRAYPAVTQDQMNEIPEVVTVERAFALDAARHLSIRGAYLGWMARPDRWSSWWLGAVPLGIKLIRQFKPDVIWSTYPIATAHLIGLTLQRLTGIPWVADFRDPMVDEFYPTDVRTRKTFEWIERRTIEQAACSVFTTPGLRTFYRERYSDYSSTRFVCIQNGYDQENFRKAETLGTSVKSKGEKITLVHSGVLYQSERDPRQFFRALGSLKNSGEISSRDLAIVLRASGNETAYQQMIKDIGIDDIVSLEPGIEYSEALAEMLSVDGLLLLQASNCNLQIPAKVYEYLRARKPILALTDPHGETAALLKSCGIDTTARLDSENEIIEGLRRFLSSIRKSSAPLAEEEIIARYSREAQTRELSLLFDDVLLRQKKRD